MRPKKSIKYKNEQNDLVITLFNLLPLDNENSFILYNLDNNTELQQQILDLIPDIKKYFNINNMASVKNSDKIQRPWIGIIRSILKPKYNIYMTEYSIKINNKTIRTRKYTFIEKKLTRVKS